MIRCISDIGYDSRETRQRFAGYAVTNNGTIAAEMVALLAPETRHTRTGRHARVLGTLPRKVTWQAVQHWMRTDDMLPADISDAWEDRARQEAARWLAVATRARAHSEKQRARILKKPHHFKPGNDAWKKRRDVA